MPTEKQREYAHRWYLLNRERLKPIREAWNIKNAAAMKDYRSRYNLANAETRREKIQKFTKEHPELVKEWRKRSKIKCRARNLEWQRAYNARTKERRKQYNRSRIENDPMFRLRRALEARIRIAVKKKYGKKARKTMSLVGCDIPFLRTYIESRFKEGMSWTNYGYGADRWNIDHVIPCSRFDLSQSGEQQQCFHYSNLQPLWHVDNRNKSDSIPLPHQAQLL